ncbi:MAG TPA: hypothetical protein VGG06_21090 [Thermoanaerobaculia bacterium]
MTAGEAVTGGFWRVVPLDDERFGLFRHWESPEDGDEPFGTFTDRDTALLAAAFLPLVDRARSFSVDPEDAAPGGPVLYRDGRAVGRIRYGDPELTEALNLAGASAVRLERTLKRPGRARGRASAPALNDDPVVPV